MFVLAEGHRGLLIFRLDFCSDQVLFALEFQLKFNIISSLFQEVLLKVSPFFLSKAVTFIDSKVFLANGFSIRPALGEKLKCSDTSLGTGSYKTICSTDACYLALTPAAAGAGSCVAIPSKHSVGQLFVYSLCCLHGFCRLLSSIPCCHETLAHELSQLKWCMWRTTKPSQQHQQYKCAIKFTGRRRMHQLSIQQCSCGVCLAGRAGEPSCSQGWVASPLRRHMVSPRNGQPGSFMGSQFHSKSQSTFSSLFSLMAFNIYTGIYTFSHILFI